MPPHSSNPAEPQQATEQSRTGRRLIAAAALIGLAFGALVLLDRFREHPNGLTPPHEPSQALITSPTLESNVAVNPELPTPPPPQVLNNETLLAPPRATGATPSARPAEKTAMVPGKAYMVQVGVFSLPANAQALQKQLQREGFESHLETRVQLGPFKNKRDADKELARARKLGIDAVLVGAR